MPPSNNRPRLNKDEKKDEMIALAILYEENTVSTGGKNVFTAFFYLALRNQRAANSLLYKPKTTTKFLLRKTFCFTPTANQCLWKSLKLGLSDFLLERISLLNLGAKNNLNR